MSSPYSTMEERDKILLSNNIKLLVRHSLRPSLKNLEDPDSVSLTPEGVDRARSFGRYLQCNWGVIMSSPILRCRETASAISGTECIEISDVLGYLFVEDSDTSKQWLNNHSMKQTVYEWTMNEKIEGFIPVYDGLQRLLDLLFSTGNLKGCVDLYCTHDLQLSVIDTFMLSKHKSLSEITTNWPHMLESMWFWGKREDFFCSWRGITKHFVNF